MSKKYEDYGIVLDFLPQGRSDDNRPAHLREPIAQILGEEYFTLLEAVVLPGVTLNPRDRVCIRMGKRKEIERIKRRIGHEELTSPARAELPSIVEELVKKNRNRFIEFFNKAAPVTSRYHQLELLPGIGKKHMWAILESREKKPFESFEDLKNRIESLSDPKEMIVKRIEKEFRNEDKYHLFVRRPKSR